MNNTEDEIRQDLMNRAEKQFGKIRAGELRADIEQLGAELFRVHSFPVELDDEP